MTIYCERCALFLAQVDSAPSLRGLFVGSFACFCTMHPTTRTSILNGDEKQQDVYRQNLMRALLRLDITPETANKIVTGFFPLTYALRQRLEQMDKAQALTEGSQP